VFLLPCDDGNRPGQRSFYGRADRIGREIVSWEKQPEKDSQPEFKGEVRANGARKQSSAQL
jgi:hypothetical protein